ncbi:MAG TPA: VOC family protein [Acidimicrobiales bacterium]|nr:VOC family protein [Acidimicrobiales bacterium]
MFNAYLFFSGTCREAFTRYHEIFGGELFVMTNADAPDGGMPGAPADAVIHAAIKLDNGGLLMASDDPGGDGSGTKGVSVSYTAKDTGEAKRVFDALAEGGEVTGPMQETFFAPAFGTCTDKWGVAWMVTTEPAQA